MAVLGALLAGSGGAVGGVARAQSEAETKAASQEKLPTSAARPGHLGGGRDRLDSPVEWIAIGSLCLAVVAGIVMAIRASHDSNQDDDEEDEEADATPPDAPAVGNPSGLDPSPPSPER